MGPTAMAPCEDGPLLEDPETDCSRQRHHGWHVRAKFAIAATALAAVVAVALLAAGGSRADNGKTMLFQDRVAPGFINYNAEEKKDVNCRFQRFVDENHIGQVKPEGVLEYALCFTDAMQVYYLLLDETTQDLLPGDKVILTLEVTHQSTTGSRKPPWEEQNMPLYKVLTARSSEDTKVTVLNGNNQVKEMIVLTILCKYDDYAPDYTSEQQAELDLFATPSEVPAGQFHGSMADMTKIASYGKVVLPRSRAKTVTVQMGSKWGSVTGCPVYDIARTALQKVKEQHPSINPDEFTSREFFIPRSPDGGCTWGGLGSVGCGHPSVLPNLGGCFAWYRYEGSFIRAHELGHNLGLLHGGGDDAGRQNTFVEYGDPTAAMGASYRFSSFIASSRFFLGVLGLGEGGVVDWSNGADKPLTLQSKSLPLGQTGAEAVAIRIKCPTCVPKVSAHAHKVGGYIWVSFRGDEGYSAIQNRGLEKVFQNKVYVHLAREFSNSRANQGTELWKVLAVGESYRPANLQFTIYVCSIVEDLAKVTVGSSVGDASSKCAGTLRPQAIRWATHPDKCLDIAGGANRDGTNIQLWDCVSNGEHENMQFLVPLSGTGRIQWAKHPTKCLDVSAGNTNNGANLQIWSCKSADENPNMQFLVPSEQGPIRWATHRNKCIHVSGGGTKTGTNIQMWDCDDNGENPNMKFTMRKPLRPLAIRWATHPDKCLDVSGGENTDGTNIQLWDCLSNGEHENMQFLLPSSGTGRIQWAKHPTKCLDVSAGSTNNGANLQIWSCESADENPNMQFNFPSEQGPIRWATHTNKCLDVSGGNTGTGTNIQMWDCHDGGQHRNMQFTVSKPL